MIELQTVKLLDYTSLKTFEVSQFMEYQQTKRQDASKQFEVIMEKVSSVVQKVCADVTNLARSTEASKENPFDILMGTGGAKVYIHIYNHII